MKLWSKPPGKHFAFESIFQTNQNQMFPRRSAVNNKFKKYFTDVLYIGLDIHKSFTVAHVLNQFGKKVMSTNIRGHWENIFAFLLGIPGELHMCYEASNGYGYLYDNISKIAKSVQVAHSGHCRLIFRSKRKNNRIDAEKLAKLLYAGRR